MRGTRWLVSAVLVGMVSAACGGDSNGGLLDDAGGGDGNGDGIQLPTDLTNLPTDLPDGGGGQFTYTSGSAHVEITGDVDATLDLPLEGQGSGGEDGGIGVGYTNGEGDAFAVGGLVADGSSDTNALLVVTASVVDDTTFGVWISNAGECTVAIDEQSEDALRGSVRCEDVGTEGQVVDIVAQFTAEA